MKFKNSDEAYNYLVNKALMEGISKRDIAKKLGVSPQHISNTIRRGNVKLSSLKELAKTLDVEVDLRLTDKTTNYDSNKKRT